MNAGKSSKIEISTEDIEGREDPVAFRKPRILNVRRQPIKKSKKRVRFKQVHIKLYRP